MITKIIGIGAAGNKAAISATEEEIVELADVLLINSTLKDIPKDYQGKSYCFADAYGGCGKERSVAKELCARSLQEDEKNLGLEEFLALGTDRQAELVVLASSTEGGTGSGTVPILAKYINQVYGIDVHCFAFMGFEEDARGLKNTVEYMQEMEKDFAVEVIQNSKFLDECNGNRIKAEKAANTAFCKKISILMGNPLRDSDHNIDQTDLLKVSTTPGYMIIEYREFKKIKNKADFETMIENMVDTSKTLDLNDPSQKRLAMIINIDEDNTDIISYQDVLIKRFGMCYEKFEHIQHESDMPEFVAFISAGSRLPIQEVEDIYEKYKQYTGKVVKNKDDFFQKSRSLEFDAQDEEFNIQHKEKSTINKKQFFAQVEGKKFQNTVVKVRSETNVEENPVNHY